MSSRTVIIIAEKNPSQTLIPELMLAWPNIY